VMESPSTVTIFWRGWARTPAGAIAKRAPTTDRRVKSDGNLRDI
jgi:hypothetical protein